MPTLVVKTIGSGGGYDYSTIAAFIAAAQARGVVANDEIWQGQLAAETFTENPSFSGLTGDATRYVELTTMAGASWKDGADAGGLRYNPSNGAAIAGSIAVLSPYVRLTGIQARITGGGATGVYINSGGTNTRFTDCIFECGGDYVGYFETASGTHNHTNCLFVLDSSANKGGIMFRNAGTWNMKNCAVVRPSNRTAYHTAYWCDWVTLNLDNCAGFGFSAINNGWIGTARNNAADVAISFGSNNQASLTYADQFEEPDSGAGVHDFRLKAGSALIANGYDLTGVVDTDIVGKSRAAPYDIGPWAADASAPAVDAVGALSLLAFLLAGTALSPVAAAGAAPLAPLATQGAAATPVAAAGGAALGRQAAAGAVVAPVAVEGQAALARDGAGGVAAVVVGVAGAVALGEAAVAGAAAVQVGATAILAASPMTHAGAVVVPVAVVASVSFAPLDLGAAAVVPVEGGGAIVPGLLGLAGVATTPAAAGGSIAMQPIALSASDMPLAPPAAWARIAHPGLPARLDHPGAPVRLSHPGLTIRLPWRPT